MTPPGGGPAGMLGWHGLEELECRLLLSGSLPNDPAALNLSGLDPKDPLVSLASLYDQYTLFQQTATNVPPGGAPAVFNVSDPLMQVTAGNVAVEAIGFDTTDALKNDLLRLGLQDVAQVNYVVAGQLPIASIVELPLLDTLRFVRAEAPAIARAGLIDGQGDGPLESDDARSFLGVDGTGITIGIISDSFNTSSSATVSWPTDVTNGETPGPANVRIIQDGAASDTDEGRAMAQIVHDIAPGADIGFHVAGGSETNFITAINQLASGAAMSPLNAADIIVDDIGLYREPMLRQSNLSQAIDALVASGVAYFSAAGNDADLSYTTGFDQDAYEAPSTGFFGGFAHDFDPGAGVDTLQQITIAEDSSIDISLQWDDTWGSYGEAGVTRDLDIYLYDAAGTTVLASAATNDLGQDPVAVLSYTNPSGSGVTTFNIKIVQDTGSATPPASNPGTIKYIMFADNATIDEFATASPTVFGHSAANGAYSVGAAWYLNTPSNGADPAVLQSFSGLGGTPIVQDNSGLLLPNPIIPSKPDAVAPDRVNTSFFGVDSAFDTDLLPNFSGTSAAAPHAAAVAALMLEANGTLSPAQVYNALNTTARDMDTAGYDALTGYGLIDAFAAVSAVNNGGVFGRAYLDVDGNGVEDTGEVGFDGAVVFADDNNNGKLDQNTTAYHQLISGPTTIPDNSTLSSFFAISGVTDPVVDINVRLDIEHPAIETLIIQLTGPSGQVIDLVNLAALPGAMQYSTTFDDEAQFSINAAPSTSGVFRPEQALSLFDGLDPNGLWTLDIIDTLADGSNPSANLYSWRIELTTGEVSTVTDTNGDYFLPLDAGTYTIAVDPGFGFGVTEPVAATYPVTLASGDVQFDKTFGLEPLADISARDMVDILPKIGDLIDKVIGKISDSTLGSGPVTPLDFLIAAQQIPFVDAKLDELIDFGGTFTGIADRLFDFAKLEAQAAPTGGSLTADASMLVMIDNFNPVLVTVPSGTSGGVASLVTALNTAFTNAGIDPLVQAVANGDNTRIVIEPIVPGIGRTLAVTTLFLEPGTTAAAFGQLSGDLSFDIVRDRDGQTISNTITVLAAPPVLGSDPYTQDNSSVADLVDDLNVALANALVFDVLAIVDPSDANKLIFAAADSVVERIELQAVSGNLADLGFATTDQVRSNTNTNTGQTELGFFNQQAIGTLKFKGFSEFETELQAVLDSLFTLPPSLTLTYDAVDDILFFTIGLDASFTKSIDLNFDDGIDLGPFGTLEVAADAAASFDAGGTLELQIGVHVGDLISGFTFDSTTLLSTLNAGSGAPISVGVTGPNAIASDGKLTGDATINLSLDGAAPVLITVPQSATASNFDEYALAADLNDAIAASTLAGRIEAAYDSGALKMILRVLDPTVQSIALTGGGNEAELGFNALQSGDFDDLLISVNMGPAFAVNLHGSTTVQDVIDAIETAAFNAGESISVTINDSKGFTLTEAGGQKLEVMAAVNFGNASPAAFSLGIAGTAEDGVLVGASLHGVNLNDRLFIEEKPSGQNNLGLSVSANANANVSAALGLISAGLTTSTPLDFGISTGLRLLDPGTSAVDGRIYLEEILANPLASLIEVNTISTTAQGQIDLNSAFFSNVDDASPLVSVGVQLTDTSPKDFSSIDFFANFNADKLKGFKDFTVEDIITIVDSVILQLKDGSALPSLSATMPVLGKSLTEAVDFLDSLRTKFNDLVASIDQTALEAARDGLQTAIDDLGLPIDQRDSLYEALDSLFEALAETDPARIASRIVAASAQLTQVIDPIVTAGTVAGNVELGAALDVLKPLVPSLNDLESRLMTALGVAQLDIEYLDYDNNALNGVQRTVAIHIGDNIGPVSFVDTPELLTQEFGPLTFDAGADLNFFAGGTYDISFGMNLDAATLADKLFVIVKAPTHPGAAAFDPTQINLNAGFAVDASGDIGLGALDLVQAAGGLNLSNALKATATEVSAGQWTFTGTSFKDEFVIAAVNGAVHGDYTVSGNTITFNTAVPSSSDTVEVTYLGSDPSTLNPSLTPNQAGLSVDLNDPGFSITGNALGAITLNELVDAIAGNSGPAVQINANGLVTGAIDVTALGSTADDAVTLATSLEYLLNPRLEVNEGALLSLFQNIDFDLKLIVQGIDALLALLQQGLESEFLSKLPIAGQIDTANTFIGKLRTEFVQPLEDLLNNVGGTLEEVATSVEQFVFDKLGPAGLNILGDRNGDFAITAADVDIILTQELFDIRVKLAGEDKVQVDFDSGLGGLPFKVDATGGVEFGWSYDMDLGFGLDKYKGFYFAVNDPTDLVSGNPRPEITLDIGAGLIVDNSGSSPVPTSLGVDLFGLQLSATDIVDTNGDSGTFVSGELNLDLSGVEIVPNGLSTYGYDVYGVYAGDLFQNFTDVFDASVDLTAQIDLLLAAEITSNLPSISTELYAGWSLTIDTTNGLQTGLPEVEFRDITLDLGDFIGKTIGPVLDKVNEAVGPIKPVIDFLLTEVPGVSKLSELAGKGPVTFLDMAFRENPTAGAQTKKFVGIVNQILDISAQIAGVPGSETVALNFGTLAFGSGNGVNLSDPFWNDDGNSGLDSALTSAAGSVTDVDDQVGTSGQANLGAVFETTQRDPDSNGLAGLGLKFDLIQDPTNIFKYLLGQTANIVTWNIPRFELGFDWEASFRPIPVVPPLKVVVGLGIDAFADLSVGFDTRGRETGNFLDGFFFGDRENVFTGADIEEFGVGIGVRLRAELDILIASAGIEGEVRADVFANWRDTDDNGKLYIDEIAGIIQRDGVDCLFDITGEVRAILRVVWEVFGADGAKDIIDKVLFSFENQCPKYELGHVLDTSTVLSDGNSYGAGTLVVNAGPFASLRRSGSTSDIAEDFTVTQTGPGVFTVAGLGLESVYDGVSSVYFDGGNGNDVFTLVDNVGSPVSTTLYGGAGNDTLNGGEGVDTVDGGAGSDTINTFGAADVITGGDDGDIIDSGAGSDIIDSGAGNDTITSGSGNDTIDAGSGDDTIDAGLGNDTIDAGLGNDIVTAGAGIDAVVGGQGNDQIDGGDGADVIFGNAGRDIILAGDGNDEVHAGSGNDQVFGEGGDDKIFGDSGSDLIYGDNGDTRTAGTPGDDEIWAGHDNDLLVGQEGTDILMGGWGNDVIIAHLIGTSSATTLDYIEGGPDDDFICGTDGSNTIYGGTADFGLADIIGNPATAIYAGGFSIASCDDIPVPIPTDPNEIRGAKFDDQNKNGVQDIGELGLAGWTIEVYDTAGDLVDTMVTDANGDYGFTDLDPGTYTVSEVMQPGWFQTTPTGTGTFVLSLNSGDISVGNDFGNAQGVENPGAIHGQKWLDSSGVGDRNSFDPGLNGITIELYDALGNLVDSQVTMSMDVNGDGKIDAITEQGLYWFEGLAAGDYLVSEASDPGYVQTFPANPQDYTVTLAEGQVVTGLDFGNQLVLGQIHGTKWHDLNHNGVQDQGCEVGLAGFTIYLDQNQNGILDPGEDSTTTDANGDYWFLNLQPGTYYVSELLPNADWEQTYPGGGGIDAVGNTIPGAHTITIDYGTTRYNVNFGNRVPGDINGDGFVGIIDLNIVLANWNSTFPLPNCARETGDLNGDGFIGIADLNEVLGNWNKGQSQQAPALDSGGVAAAAAAGPLGIASDFNGTLYDVDVTGPVLLTNPRFTGIDNIADIAISPIDGTLYALTSNDLIYTIDIASGASSFVGSLNLPFSGVFLDGALDFDSTGTLYGVHMGNSFGAPFSELFTVDTTTGLGTFIGPIITGINVDISAMAFDDLDQLFAVDDQFLYQIDPITGAAFNQIALTPTPGAAEVVVGMDYDSANGDLVMGFADTFGLTNWYRIDITTGMLSFIGSWNATISGLEFTGAPPPQTGVITGVKFEDLDGDGVWGPAEQGLAGWTIYLDLNGDGILDAGDISTVTGAGGSYSFVVAEGSYIVREVLQPGWTQTLPGTGFYTVNVIANVTALGIDFGNQPPPPTGGITGTKFNDLNGDGVHDLTEPGLPGWTIYLDINGNRQFDAGDLSTLTDANGNYAFGNLTDGPYTVAEVQQSGWTQTTPTGIGTYTVSVAGGGTITGLDFGNQQGSGELHGTKWSDTNADGVRDPGEPGWAGVSIYLDLNDNGVLDPGEPTTVTMEDDPNTSTDETGMYWFTGLTPGSYVVREVVPQGSQQTYPLGGGFVGADMAGTFFDLAIGLFSFQTSNYFTSIGEIIGITQVPGTDLLYAMNTFGDLHTFNRATGVTSLLGRIGPPGVQYEEGDIDIDPTTGEFYFVTGDSLFKADLSTAANPLGATVTLVGSISGAKDLSAMAFDANGDLWVYELDAIGSTSGLIQIDKTNADTLFFSADLSASFDSEAGMAFDPVTGDLVILKNSFTAILDTSTLTGSFNPIGSPVSFQVSALEYLLFDNAHRVTLQQGQIITGLDFGNTELIPLPDGDDIIYGINGDDTIYGDNLILTDPRIVSEGSRADTIFGNGGADTIFGQEGDDNIWGADPTLDTLGGIDGDDTIDGGEGFDRVLQQVDNNQTLTDTLLTGQGSDSLVRIEAGTLIGGDSGTLATPQFLDATAFNGPVILIGGAGVDFLFASTTGAFDDELFGNAGDDVLASFGGNDQLTGGPGDDTQEGGIGDDTYLFLDDADPAEVDTLTDIGGTDTLDFSALPNTAPVTVDMLSGPLLATHGTRTVTTADPTQFENAIGGAGDDTLGGNANDNLLIGNAGNDTLRGLIGLDTLNGGAGNDVLEGGAGDDLYLFDTAVGSEIDTITEDATLGGGSDTLNFSSLSIGDNLTVNLSEAASTTFASHTGRTLVTLSPGDAALIENVTGGAGDDSLTDNQADNTLIGNTGNDVYFFVDPTGAQTDTVAEQANEGTDRLDFGMMTTGVQVDLVLATAIGADDLGFRTINTLAAGMGLNIENLNGGLGNDDLFANDSANVIRGGAGIDELRGREDNDVLMGGSGNDTLRGGKGNDTLTGGMGNDQLTAGAGDDSLDGGRGSDTLDGGKGNDTYLFANMPVTGFNETDSIVEAVGPLGGTDTLDFGTLTQGVTVDLSGTSAFAAQHTNGGLSPTRTINTGDFTLLENAIGGAGDDSFTDNNNSNVFTGGAGSDTFIFTLPTLAQTDRVDEQPASPTDVDTLDFGNLNIAVTVDLSVNDAINPIATDGTRTLRTVTAGTAINFENITGGSANDLLTGNSKDNVILGGAGNDALTGLAGNDTLDPGTGTNETLSGGAGDDTYLFDDVISVRTLTLTEDSGIVSGGLAASGGLDTLDFSQVSAGLGTLSFDLNLTTQTLNGLTINLEDSTPAANSDYFENVTGSSTINNALTGNDANNTLIGGAGSDQLDGGLGDDTLSGAAGADTLNGGDGNDLVLGGDGVDILTGGNDRDILIGGNQADNLTGDGGDDILIGGSTVYDDLNDPADTNARNSLFAAWLSTFDSYGDRINTLTNGIGTSNYKLDNTTVLDDGGAVDILAGSASLDWFFVGSGDDDSERDTLNEQAVSI
jgi:Ca2+-binding RTX toxin-like protein/subtilisin-like proprotein convertase family protein